MAEEDEIDVLGDFNLDNFLSKNTSSIYDSDNPPLVSQNSDLLNCDYTIHPQWLLDKPSANPDNWYDNSNSVSIEGPQTEDCLGQVSTEDCITDESGWTEKEKNLLERGIEIFGKSNIRLSQFVGSKTASEVKYYLKNFYLDNSTGYKGFTAAIEEPAESNLVSDVLDEKQIPASIEEVIAAVSTAKPTIPVSKKSRKRSSSTSTDHSESMFKDVSPGQSVLKSNHSVKFKLENIPLKTARFKKLEHTYKCNKNLQKNKERKPEKSIKFKFKTKFHMPLKDNKNRTNLKTKPVQSVVKPGNDTKVGRIEITTGKGLAVPIYDGEEIVKIAKTEEDSDLDIEVDIDDSDTEKPSTPKTLQTPEKNSNSPQVTIKNESPIIKEPVVIAKTNTSEKQCGKNLAQPAENTNISEDVLKELNSMEFPSCELVLHEQVITDLEKVIHSEYFEGRMAKTPERYLKIRNHILNAWKLTKPNYVRKTTMRRGLLNCGDVNGIGHIHYFLEQIGAINFGCEQVSYERPLSDMIRTPAPPKEKPVKELKQPEQRQFGELGPRARFKKKFNNDGEGGLTLTHNDKGDIINTTIVNEEPPPKPRPYIKKPIVKLIYCRPFTEEKPQEYSITINISTLLQMDFHAHMCLSEVMGLVAGCWNNQTKSLTISHYEPCKNMASSSTHCDMCPISQAKAADNIHSKGLDILGWYHSHPTFAPEPSQQDLDTQQFVQQWIGHGKPCIGVILSPFSANGALIASPLRCLIVDKKPNFDDQFVPYKFNANVQTHGFLLNEFLSGMRRILDTSYDMAESSRIRFDKPYFLDESMTYLEKFISSVRMHLAKNGTLDKSTCELIIKSIEKLVNSKH